MGSLGPDRVVRGIRSSTTLMQGSYYASTCYTNKAQGEFLQGRILQAAYPAWQQPPCSALPQGSQRISPGKVAPAAVPAAPAGPDPGPAAGAAPGWLWRMGGTMPVFNQHTACTACKSAAQSDRSINACKRRLHQNHQQMNVHLLLTTPARTLATPPALP